MQDRERAFIKSLKLSGAIDYMPSNLDEVTPIYEELDGWDSISGIRNYDDLPQNAKIYIKRIEELTGVRVSIISTSPERSDTILR